MMATPLWHLIGAGHIGALAAVHLGDAGHRVRVIREAHPPRLDARLTYADGGAGRTLSLPVSAPAAIDAPITHLWISCKTPYTAERLARLPLADDVTVVRLQNGIGSLDGRLPAGARLLEAVTTSAVRGTRDAHHVVAENDTWMGGPRLRPPWFDALARHWPGLRWSDDIRRRQWHKLVANAAINPLTALYDVDNGALLQDARLYAQMRALVAEADAVLARLDATWPGDSLAGVEAVAQATAANTSSMRADVQRGARTEIDAINGWLLRQGEALGVAVPQQRRMVEALGALAGDAPQR